MKRKTIQQEFEFMKITVCGEIEKAKIINEDFLSHGMIILNMPKKMKKRLFKKRGFGYEKSFIFCR